MRLVLRRLNADFFLRKVAYMAETGGDYPFPAENALQLFHLALGLDDEQFHGQNTKAWAASSSSPAGGVPKTIEGSVVVEPPTGVLGEVLALVLAPD